MFNTHITKAGNSYNETKVKEYRAPTDESVKLLAEMEEKALNRIISMTRLENNTFNATWWVRYSDCFCDQKEAICRYMLNGKEHEFKIKLREMMYRNTQEVGQMIMDQIKHEIAYHLAIELWQQQGKTIFER